MDIEEARAWVRSPATQRYLQQMDDDADAARDVQRTNLRQMGSYPSGTVSAYRALLAPLDRAQGDFNTEINNITLGRARDGRAALAAYRAYVAALMALEAENGRVGAFIEADAAALAERLCAALYAFTAARIDREGRAMQRDLERMQRDLERARRELREAEAQRVLNGVLGVVGLILSFVELPVGVARAVAAGSFAVPMMLDAALGPSRPDALGTANSALGGVSNWPRLVRPGVSRFSGAVGALTSYLADGSEVDTAAGNLRETARNLQRFQRVFETWSDRVEGAAGEVTIARRMWETAIDRARRAATAASASDSEYRDLQRQIESIR